jgi:hypothetical protein
MYAGTATGAMQTMSLQSQLQQQILAAAPTSYLQQQQQQAIRLVRIPTTLRFVWKPAKTQMIQKASLSTTVMAAVTTITAAAAVLPAAALVAATQE